VSASGTLVLHYADANIVADELAGYGPEVVVVSPPAIRAAVKERLLRVAADHSTAHYNEEGRPTDG
jgi:proteasome accessory factor B